jgi:hypothetical protein
MSVWYTVKTLRHHTHLGTCFNKQCWSLSGFYDVPLESPGCKSTRFASSTPCRPYVYRRCFLVTFQAMAGDFLDPKYPKIIQSLVVIFRSQPSGFPMVWALAHFFRSTVLAKKFRWLWLAVGVKPTKNLRLSEVPEVSRKWRMLISVGGAPPNNFRLNFRVMFFRDQVLDKIGSIDFNWFQFAFNWFQFSFNWF